MRTNQEIEDLQAKVREAYLEFDGLLCRELSVNSEFIAISLLTCFGVFLGGNITKEDALRAFNMGIEFGERITETVSSRTE